jgi:hypothetical protein
VNDDTGPSDQVLPAVAMDSSGNFVITWTDEPNFWPDIYAQRYNSSGIPLGSNFKVNDTAISSQLSPAIAMDGSGNFIITWWDSRNGNWDIYAQRYNSTGTPLGSNFKVNDDPGASSQQVTDIATTDSGNFIIAWKDYRNGDPDIYAQKYDASGNPQDSNYLVPNPSYGSFNQVNPAVAANSSNIYFTWMDDRRSQGYDIYAKVVDWSWMGVFCGDVTQDGSVDVADVVYLINYLFIHGPAPYPISVADVNLDGVVEISDVVYLINYLFIGGPPPCSQ